MRIFRFWQRGQLVLVFHLLAISLIGMGHFTTTNVRHPGQCLPTESPGNRIWYWLSSGLKDPLSDYLDNTEIEQIIVMFASIMITGLWLSLSIWSMRPLRPRLNLRLRTMMALIAFATIECIIAGKALKAWDRWDLYRALGDYYAKQEKFARMIAELPQSEPSDVEAQQWQKAMKNTIAKNRRLKEIYQRAAWHPWSDVEMGENDRANRPGP